MPSTMVRTLVCSAVVASILGISACSSDKNEFELVYEAKQLAQEGQLSAAVIELKNALTINPDNAEARLFLGRYYLRLDQVAAAEKELEVARKLGVTGMEVLEPLARSLLIQSRYEDVLKLFPDEGDIPEKQSLVLALKGHAYTGMRDYTQAELMYTQSLENNPDSIEAFLGLARVALYRRNISEAERYLNAAKELDSENPETWLLAGDVAAMKGDPALSAEFYSKALELSPWGFRARVGKALALLDIDQIDEAEKNIDALDPRFQKHVMVDFLRGGIAFKRKQYKVAQERMRQVVNRWPDNYQALLVLGAASYALGEYEQSYLHLSRYVSNVRGNLTALKMLAISQLRLGKTEEVEQVIKQADVDVAEDEELLKLLAEAAIRAGNYDSSTGYLRQLVRQQPENPELRTLLGRSLRESLDTQGAIDEFDKALQLGGDITNPTVELVGTLLNQGRAKEAYEYASRLLEKQPDSAFNNNLMGAVQVGLSDIKSAREYFTKAVKLDPSFSPAALNLARIEFDAGEIDNAKARYQSLIDQENDEVSAMMALARIANYEGDRESELKWLKNVLAKDDGNFFASLILIRRYQEAGDQEGVRHLLDKTLEHYPDNPILLSMKAQRQMNAGNNQAALETYLSIVKRLPESIRANLDVAKAYFQLGLPDKAIPYLNTVLKIDPDQVIAQSMLASQALKDGQFSEAEAIAGNLDKIAPDSPYRHLLRAEIAMKKQQFIAAAAWYEKNFAADPSSVAALGAYQAYIRGGEPEKSILLLQSWLELHPEDIRMRHFLARYYIATKNYKTAIQEYRKIIDLEANDLLALNNLSVASRLTGDYQAAVDFAERAYGLASNRPQIIDTYGMALLESGKKEQAVSILESAASLAPGESEIQFHYAQSLAANGQNAEALAILNRLLAIENIDSNTKDQAVSLQEKLGKQ